MLDYMSIMSVLKHVYVYVIVFTAVISICVSVVFCTF